MRKRSAEEEYNAARAACFSDPPSPAGSIVTQRMSDIEAKPISWLWPGRIPRGKLTIIAGNPGLGKSQIMASIAAVVTTGGRWPVDRHQCEPGDVVFLSAEDDPADTLRPRLEAAGAELHRVHIVRSVFAGLTGEGKPINRLFCLESDVDALNSKLDELHGVACVMIDPVTAYLGRTDSHKNAEIRGLLTPLCEMATRLNTAVIGLSHLAKTGSRQALLRVMGSLAFVAAARSAYLVGSDPADDLRRLFLPLKNNLGPEISGLAFSIEGVTVESPAGLIETSRVSWAEDSVSVTADEVMRAAETQTTSSTALDEAKDWLGQTLQRGPVSAEEIFKRAEQYGISKKTLSRASQELGVKKEKLGMKGPWRWSLPTPKMADFAEDAQHLN